MTDEPMSAAVTDELAWKGTAQSQALGVANLDDLSGMRAPFRADLVDDPDQGGLANGVVTTLLDQACGMAVGAAAIAALGEPIEPRRFGGMATLDLRIDFIRPAKPGRDVIGKAECYKIAGGVAFVRGVAFEDDPADPIAATQAAFMLSDQMAGLG